MNSDELKREVKGTLGTAVGGIVGLQSGAAIGAIVGGVLGGPVGAVIGAKIGGVAGTAHGAITGATDPDSAFKGAARAHMMQPHQK